MMQGNWQKNVPKETRNDIDACGQGREGGKHVDGDKDSPDASPGT